MRIRTVKPEFLRHEELQDLEVSHPGKCPMLVFEGLWMASDKNGVFPWRPRILKLDILPFIPFDMADTLDMLASSGLIVRFESDGKAFGHIPTFGEHQRINGSEVKNPSRFPDPPKGSTEDRQIGTDPSSIRPDTYEEAPRKHQGSTKEAPGTDKEASGNHRGKVGDHGAVPPRKHQGSTEDDLGPQEREREGKGTLKSRPAAAPPENILDLQKSHFATIQTACDLVDVQKKKLNGEVKDFEPRQFAIKMLNAKCHPAAVSKALMRLSEELQDIRGRPWPYALSIVQKESGNFHEADAIAIHQEMKDLDPAELRILTKGLLKSI